MSLTGISLRALEPSDIEVLIELENNQNYWKYSNRNEPFSRALMENYIQQQSQDIFEVKQKRFVISKEDNTAQGFIDIFNFEPIHRRAGIGIILKEEYRGKGIGKKAIDLVGVYAQKHLNLNSIYADIAKENKLCIHAFESCGFIRVGLKKSWNFYDGKFHDEYLYQKLL